MAQSQQAVGEKWNARWSHPIPHSEFLRLLVPIVKSEMEYNSLSLTFSNLIHLLSSKFVLQQMCRWWYPQLWYYPYRYYAFGWYV